MTSAPADCIVATALPTRPLQLSSVMVSTIAARAAPARIP
jgi:hypothetical protein